MKKTLTTLFAVVALAVLAYAAYLLLMPKHALAPVAADYKNISYTIDDRQILLQNGVSEIEVVPGSASKPTTTYFGNEATGDLNGDGKPDVAFILTQSGSGSGTFYYVVGAVQAADGSYAGTDAVALGDRIAPQTTEIKDGKVVVNYADRSPGEPMATPPSQGKTLVLKLDPSTMKFGVVVQNFEGEANPAVMKLDMQTWTWIQTTRTDGAPVVPKKKKFTITFKTDNTFSATTDCNGVGGEYTAKEDSITFSKMMSTLMFCEDSQEAEFSQMLSDARAYLFTTRGELVLRLADGASMTFK